MKSQGNLSLPELAARYSISHIFGASVAYFSSAEGGQQDLRAVTDTICCYELNLIRQGEAHVIIGGKRYTLERDSLLALTPYQPAKCHFPPDVVAEGMLIDSNFYDSISTPTQGQAGALPNFRARHNYIYKLSPEQAEELSDLFQLIRKVLRHNRLYQLEIIRSLVRACQFFVSELSFSTQIVTPDTRRKERIYNMFILLAQRNFRTHRQVPFYAAQLNITPTYLNRVVLEISGNTVGSQLTLLTYHEACNLLRSSEMNIGEIADALSFHDPSAFTNFFKLHSGCSPTEYRNKP